MDWITFSSFSNPSDCFSDFLHHILLLLILPILDIKSDLSLMNWLQPPDPSALLPPSIVAQMHVATVHSPDRARDQQCLFKMSVFHAEKYWEVSCRIKKLLDGGIHIFRFDLGHMYTIKNLTCLYLYWYTSSETSGHESFFLLMPSACSCCSVPIAFLLQDEVVLSSICSLFRSRRHCEVGISS